MNAEYMRRLQALKRECDRELDRAQVGSEPGREILVAMRGVVEARVADELVRELGDV